MTQKTNKKSVPADPEKWSESSQRSVVYECGWCTEYVDLHYLCWRCKKADVFSENDQKYSFEVKKSSINQRRILCTECWQKSQTISSEIDVCARQWAESKNALKKDVHFLSNWLQLLISREEFVPYKPNTAAKNMLKKLLENGVEYLYFVNTISYYTFMSMTSRAFATFLQHNTNIY